MKNERQANLYMVDQAAKTCPPCTGACNQGRSCPAYYTHEIEDQSEGLTGREVAGVVGTVALALGILLALGYWVVFA